MKVGVFHPGTQHSWQTALAFQEAKELAWFATSIYYLPDEFPYSLSKYVPIDRLRSWLETELRRRTFPALSKEVVRQLENVEWLEILARRLGKHRVAGYINDYGNRRLAPRVCSLAKREPINVLWGYNTTSAEAFRWAKKQGIRCVLDQTIGHPNAMNRIMADEYRRHQEYFKVPYVPFTAKEISRQNEELELADLVVTGSEFCRETLIENGCKPQKIRIVPYGFDESVFQGVPPPSNPSGPIRFLFLGTVEPRKGIAYLLEAFRQISDAELTVVGASMVPQRVIDDNPRVKFFPQVPRSMVVTHYQQADCFIFPSLFEGGGIVLYEARAAGLGIIQSSACGDGVLADRSNGLVVNPGDTEALVAAIRLVLDKPEMLARWRESSWAAREQRQWSAYRQSIRELLKSDLQV